jgi:UDPglucose 6-dehydrogenase
VAWSPEFLQEGHAVEDVLRPNRLVFAYQSPWAGGMLYAAHKGVFDLASTEEREVPVVTCDFATAELVKVAANSFLATKISFINAMSEVCEVTGADVTLLARAIGYDPRIGQRYLQAGVGFGGGCLPKDIRAFQARAQELGAGESVRFLHEVDLINQRRRTRVLKLAAQLLDRPFGPAGPDLSGTRIAVLGATFKPNTDDVRDAPSLAVTTLLHKAGADVHVYDPQGMENARVVLPDVAYEPTLAAAVADADLVCVLTEWAEFRNADPQALGLVAAAKVVIDGRNCLDPALWTAAGWEYHGMGRP